MGATTSDERGERAGRGERREYRRVDADISSELHLPDGGSHRCTVKDVSFAGAYLVCEFAPGSEPEDTPQELESELTVDFADDPAEEYMTVRCRVVDVSGSRVGVRFTAVGEDAFEQLKRYLLAESDDPEQMLNELRMYPNPALPRLDDKFTLWERLKQLFSGSS